MAGLVKVITGEMFSGKSQELARLIGESLGQGLEVQVFYPAHAARGSHRDIDQRLSSIRGEGKLTLHPVPGGNAQYIADWTRCTTDVIAIDEAQFFSDDIVPVVKSLRREGKLVLIGGLDQDYLEHPFGRMGDLMCIANDVVKVHTFCASCRQDDAYISHRVTREQDQVVIGDNYIPLCEDCYLLATNGQAIPLFVD
ncbi:MAG: thymidine kinase [Firmicutes bacterium]|nr:thymidine kinase [Bacillota bacterium]